jgi:hypothetical protein
LAGVSRCTWSASSTLPPNEAILSAKIHLQDVISDQASEDDHAASAVAARTRCTFLGLAGGREILKREYSSSLRADPAGADFKSTSVGDNCCAGSKLKAVHAKRAGSWRTRLANSESGPIEDNTWLAL